MATLDLANIDVGNEYLKIPIDGSFEYGGLGDYATVEDNQFCIYINSFPINDNEALKDFNDFLGEVFSNGAIACSRISYECSKFDFY